jgi:hypothetical protein
MSSDMTLLLDNIRVRRFSNQRVLCTLNMYDEQ